jgi:SAM-dependent methyltransferase
MYKFIKKAYLFILPRKVHYKIEPFIRVIMYNLLYRGEIFYCPICNSNLKKFIPIYFKSGVDNSCPRCGSLSRTRSLYNYISEKIPLNQDSILDFSPHRSIYNNLSKTKRNYIANDFDNQFHADTHHDITDLPFEKESFDLIICFHVLEHIPNDDKAIANLHKVLKKNGNLLIQVPLKEGETDEDLSITDPKLRENRFGQSDHVRIYGKNDLRNKIEKKGFRVNIIDYSEKLTTDQINYFGINKGELIFHCIK